MSARLGGALLLAFSALAVVRLHILVTAWPRHSPTLVEMLLSLAAVATGIAGALMLREGRALFERQSWPTRP